MNDIITNNYCVHRGSLVGVAKTTSTASGPGQSIERSGNI